MFNYNHLYYFYLTAKLGGVTLAAKSLRIAQPSLSSQLKVLERELGLSLFQKVGRRLQLTPDGERAFVYCRRIFEAADEFSEHLKNADQRSRARCRIGVTHEIERPFVADVLSELFRNKLAHEQPLISMTSDEHSQLLEELSTGELDAIVSNHKVYGPEFRILAELSMSVLPVISPALLKRHDSQYSSGSIASFLKQRDIGLILPSEKLKLRVETDVCLQKLKIRNAIVFESDILAVVVRAALDGVGVAFLPRHYIAKELKEAKLKVLGSTVWEHRISLIARNLKVANPIVSQIKSYFSKLDASLS